VPLRADEQGLLARYVVRWGIEDEERKRWAVAMQVRRKDGRGNVVVTRRAQVAVSALLEHLVECFDR
jgi:hypothetical protein